jgi:SAM-dependent methyltransferase
VEQYSQDFYHDLDQTAGPSAAVVIPLILEYVHVDSVIDVGCGNGGWLAAFQAQGIERIWGVDGNWIDENLLQIPVDYFQRADLSLPLDVEGRFALSMSLEVTEHLPAERAPGFVKDLTRLAPVVLFSAAVPGQGGLNHINEQWPAYWANLFAAHGYKPVDFLRWAVWNDPRVTWWYKQNLLMFASDEALAASPKLAEKAQASPAEPYAVVHPERFRMAERSANPGLGRWLKMGRQALLRSIFKQGR